VYLGRDGSGNRTSDEGSDHFRLVPPHSSREKMGTTVEVRGNRYAESQSSTLKGDLAGPKGMLACARKKVRVLSNGGDGEINVTQTIHIMDSRKG
jgi:hypothetical protein